MTQRLSHTANRRPFHSFYHKHHFPDPPLPHAALSPSRQQIATYSRRTYNISGDIPPTVTKPRNTSPEVPLLYHSPRHPLYNPTRQGFSRVIFSITPTPGVYAALNEPNIRPPPVCFLHRPFNLDRKAVRRGSLVLACHKSFDEHLTVGWNVALAERLRAEVEGAICLQGYKDDPERKIGLVARLNEPVQLLDIAERIRAEFYGAGELHLGSQDAADDNASPESASAATGTDSNPTTTVLAILNAFHAEEVERVLDAAGKLDPATTATDGSRVLYLTGAAREPGLEAARKVNMPAFCVGHRACEEWGIRYLANKTRERWEGLEVIEVMEEEEEVIRPAKKAKITGDSSDSRGQPEKAEEDG